MPTIQIREIPDDAYETLRRRARDAGQSIQAYMRDQVTDLARRRTKDEAWALVEAALSAPGGTGASTDDILADLDADRR